MDAVGTTVYSHDAAGQLLSEDGPWASDTVSCGYNNGLRTNLSLGAPNASAWTESCAYDSAKRLTNVTFPADAPSGSKLKLLFDYDAQGRRISKTVSNWVSDAWQLQSTNRFVYDGWNLLAILNAQSSILASFTWGLDLSGSLQGAGGVGGLLWLTDPSTLNNQPSTHFACYDGNGNVMALSAASDGSETARYEYGPFGEPLRATGPMAKVNPFRFSTKYQDDETDLLYYGYRFYNESTGRWLSRDPLGEQAFFEVHVAPKSGSQERSSQPQVLSSCYRFLRNNGANAFDLLGLYDNCCCNEFRIAVGKAELESRYHAAYDYLQSIGVEQFADPKGRWSCGHVNPALHNFMSPSPACWTCVMETRREKRSFWKKTWDQNAVVCTSHPKAGQPQKIIFDYHANRPPGEDYDAWFKPKHPVLVGVWGGGAHDDCTHKSSKQAMDLAWLDLLLTYCDSDPGPQSVR